MDSETLVANAPEILSALRAAHRWRELHKGYWTGSESALAEALDYLPDEIKALCAAEH